MTLFLDTSALIKLYITEPGTDMVQAQVAAAQELAVSLVTYAEGRAALAALWRAKRLDRARYQTARLAWEADWTGFFKVLVSEALCREAGDLAEKFRLRGYDSIQLASFAQLAREAEPGGVAFSSFDRRLNSAANALSRGSRQPPARSRGR
ncbi:MAG TPA: type II toxin-antitoxin system VapC family toxin [Terriglobales bacterium]|nr:type II toxin-antitoxin system VapC family toxin [Terriglobales bacterium]